MAKQFWVVKQEPESYSWSDFVKDGRTAWTGVRNYQARNNLRAMKKGDFVLYYHSVTDKFVAGLARVEKEAYPDPTATEGDWVAVDIVPVKALAVPVTLQVLKEEAVFKDMLLVRNGRISVSPATPKQFDRIMALAKTKA